MNGLLHSLRGEHIFKLRQFIDAYAGSHAAVDGMHQFAEYLWKHGTLDPLWALSVVETILGNEYLGKGSRWSPGGEELTRLVLRIYNDPTIEEETSEHAMNVFDRLMERYSSQVHKVLMEWDRR